MRRPHVAGSRAASYAPRFGKAIDRVASGRRMAIRRLARAAAEVGRRFFQRPPEPADARPAARIASLRRADFLAVFDEHHRLHLVLRHRHEQRTGELGRTRLAGLGLVSDGHGVAVQVCGHVAVGSDRVAPLDDRSDEARLERGLRHGHGLAAGVLALLRVD